MVIARWLDEMFEERKQARTLEIQREVQQIWEGWNYRRLLAQEQGKEFNEPPPTLGDEGGEG